MSNLYAPAEFRINVPRLGSDELGVWPKALAGLDPALEGLGHLGLSMVAEGVRKHVDETLGCLAQRTVIDPLFQGAFEFDLPGASPRTATEQRAAAQARLYVTREGNRKIDAGLAVVRAVQGANALMQVRYKPQRDEVRDGRRVTMYAYAGRAIAPQAAKAYEDGTPNRLVLALTHHRSGQVNGIDLAARLRGGGNHAASIRTHDWNMEDITSTATYPTVQLRGERTTADGLLDEVRATPARILANLGGLMLAAPGAAH